MTKEHVPLYLWIILVSEVILLVPVSVLTFKLMDFQ